MRTILSRPSPDLQTLVSATEYGGVYTSRMFFFDLGREALAHGLTLLDIEAGSTIIVPAYMCDSNIIPLKKLGYKIIFVDVGKNLENKIEDIDIAIKRHNARAVIAVHYFGFPSNIEALLKLCDSRKIKLIEDCAHGFLTKINGVSLGSFGHLSIYSMRKTLPVPDGGALKINNDAQPTTRSKLKKIGKLRELRYFFFRSVETLIKKICYPNFYSPNLTRLKDRIRGFIFPRIDSFDILDQGKQIQPSFQLRSYINDSVYLSRISQIRRDNYNRLEKELLERGFLPWIKTLPKECVPQFFVFEDERGGLLEWLRDQGVGAINWPGPELPKEVDILGGEFPVTRHLNARLVMLPIHQSINDGDLEYMVELMEKWAQTGT